MNLSVSVFLDLVGESIICLRTFIRGTFKVAVDLRPERVTFLYNYMLI